MPTPPTPGRTAIKPAAASLVLALLAVMTMLAYSDAMALFVQAGLAREPVENLAVLKDHADRLFWAAVAIGTAALVLGAVAALRYHADLSGRAAATYLEQR